MKNAPQIKRNRLSVLFWLRTSKTLRNGSNGVYCRITLNGERATKCGFCTGVYTTPENWNSTMQIVTTDKPFIGLEQMQVEVKNERLLQIKTDLQRILAQHELAGGEFTALDIQNAYLQKRTPEPTLQEAKTLWDKRYEKYIALGEKAPRTRESYEVHHQEILAYFGKGKKLNDFKRSDWEEFRLYLSGRKLTTGKNVGKTTHPNTVAKYMVSFKGLFDIATDHELIAKNPYKGKTSERVRPEKIFLPTEKLQQLHTLKIQEPEVEKALDIFLFCAYSGVSYADYASLTNDSVLIHEGEKYIYLPYRDKSPLKKRYGKSYIPILPQLQSLIDKHKGIDNLPKDKDANRKLKFVWGAIQAPRDMCLKNARHTFLNYARTTLGIPEQTLIMIVGHSTVRTTEESYLQRNIQTLSNDLKKLNFKI